MSNITIRPAELGDAEMIADFNLRMAAETESKRLDRVTATQGVRRIIDTPGFGFYLVAVCDDELAGCMMVTSEWSDWRDAAFWWIQSVYVIPELRRRGVFRRLYAHVRDRATATPGICGLRLYVESGNSAAQATYEQLGMSRTPYQMYEIEFE